MKNLAWELVPGPFEFQRNLCKRESENVLQADWMNFDSSAITCLM